MEDESVNGIQENGIDGEENSDNELLLSCPKQTIRKMSYPELSTSPTEDIENKDKESPELPATPNPSEDDGLDDDINPAVITGLSVDGEPRTLDSVSDLLDGIIDDEIPMEIDGNDISQIDEQNTADDITLSLMEENINKSAKFDLEQELKRCQLSIMESKQTISRCCEVQEMLKDASSTYPFLERKEPMPERPWRRRFSKDSNTSFLSPRFNSSVSSGELKETRLRSILRPPNITNGKSVKFKPPPPTSTGSLFDSVFVGDYEKTKALVREGHDVNATDSYGKTPSHIASEQNHLEVLKHLIKNGAMINDSDYVGRTPLHYAVESGAAKIVDFLLYRGSSVNHTDKSMKTPLHIASEKGERAIVEMLLSHKATTVHDLDTSLKSPLHYAVENDHFPVVIHLVKSGAPVNLSDGDHRKPLHYAAAGGFIRIARFLVENGATVDALDNNLQTPLFLAAANGFKSVVNYLIFHGASIEISDNRRQTPLHITASKGFTEIVNDLVSNHVNLDPLDEEGKTPLAYAAQNRDLAMTTVLLKHGANPDLLKSDSINCKAYDNGSFNNHLTYLLKEFKHKRANEN